MEESEDPAGRELELLQQQLLHRMEELWAGPSSEEKLFARIEADLEPFVVRRRVGLSDCKLRTIWTGCDESTLLGGACCAGKHKSGLRLLRVQPWMAFHLALQHKRALY